MRLEAPLSALPTPWVGCAWWCGVDSGSVRRSKNRLAALVLTTHKGGQCVVEGGGASGGGGVHAGLGGGTGARGATLPSARLKRVGEKWE